ncbi:6046_t:CDS:2 [Entrophospora sp. SA101]|nr:11004_t:CDS:2 [Entrophospora candida]CAH1761300.1 13361_t:CDS:2 [Entrophospora sp. SA101]CAG8642216.1 9348_t:CDS:2 [Entrophospora candida]CAJ0631126.1 16105_t:CDS:2 [Entrophospora sp. SA101]CAJ0752084.1 10715_t:CDS:2 [Entrophospora sp. SA101]
MYHAKLGLKTSHRWSLLRNLVASLIEYDRIRTTHPKAKAAQRLADKVVKWAKIGNHHARTQAKALLRDPNNIVVPKLFKELAKRYKEREGGYTRVHKLGFRPGDKAEMAILEYVDAPGDLKYQMLVRQLARREIDPSLKVSEPEKGQFMRISKYDRKKLLNRLNGQKKFLKKVEKMKKSLKLTDEDLQQRVETEKDKLEWQDENIEFQRRERRERMKGGLESYADFM